MNTANPHIAEDDLALFALALMPPEEAAYARAHLKHCDVCRSEVARMQGDLVSYAFSAEMLDAPAQSRSRLLEAVAKEKQLHVPAPVVVEEPFLAPRQTNLLDRNVAEMPERRRGLGFFGWAGWALAATFLGFAGWQFYEGQGLREQLAEQTANAQQVDAESARAQRVLQALTDPSVMQVAMHVPTTGTAVPPKPEGHASYDPYKGELVFVATHLQAVEANKTYQLWVLPASGDAPVSAGVFRPDRNGNASVVLPSLPKNVAAKGFGVTLENEGGSRTPTMPILLMST